jgi:long-chain acyl-CoA synthetase
MMEPISADALRNLRFARFARSNPNAIAIVDPVGKHWSRAELHQLSNRIARSLRRNGLQPGDAIALVAPNSAEYMAIYLAAMQIGLHFVPVNWHLSPSEVGYILNDAQPKAIFSHNRYCKFVGDAMLNYGAPTSLRISIGSSPLDFVALDELIANESSDDLTDTTHGRILLYTSATTGKPKAVSLPLSNADRAIDGFLAFQIRKGIVPEKGNVQLCASMLYHSGPLNAVAAALHLGHIVVLVDRWEAERMLQLIQEYRVTSAFMVPSMFIQFLKLPAATRAQYDVSTLRTVTHSAAPCPVETKRQMIKWWGPIIWELYGATEGSGTSVSAEEWLKYPGTVGRPILGSKIRIVDDSGNDLPPGQVGTIYLTRFTGDRFEYKGDPEKTRAAYRGEFFTAGDVGYLNEEGYLFVSDRKIDMIIIGGSKVYSAEIESVLVLHPKVADCAVFGVPDSINGEAIQAIVQPANGVVGDIALKQELLIYLGKQISAAKLPRYIEFADHLPRDPAGKLRKRLLRDAYWPQTDRRI